MLVCLFLTLAISVVYWQIKTHPFVSFDDYSYIIENPHVRTGMTTENIRWAFTATYASNWHPLTWISHMADCQLFGLNAGRHHLVNVFFHIANTILLFLILNRMTRALWQSAFVAALFALHPLHVESVAWAAERKDVLSTLFWMLTMGAYAFYVEQPSTRRYLPTLLFFALGLMAKPMLVTLPFVLLLLDYWPLKRLPRLSQENQQPAALQVRESKKQKKKPKGQVQEIMPAGKLTAAKNAWPMIRHLLWEKTPFFLLAALSSIITVYAQRGAIGTLETLPFGIRLQNALISYARYMVKMFWPLDLAVFYPLPPLWPSWMMMGSIASLAAITWLAVITVKRHPYLMAGWLWYLGTLIPVIGIVQVGKQSLADRYTYIPLIGLFIMLAWGIPAALRVLPFRRVSLVAATVAALSTLLIMTGNQLKYWQNSMTLFEHAIEVTQNNSTAHAALAGAFIDQGQKEEAIKQLQKALRINPDEVTANINMGHLLLKQGKTEEAIFYFQRALRTDPRHPVAHYNMANALLSKGMIGEAIFHFQEAVRINPDYAEAHYNMGNALASEGRNEEAIAHFRGALRIHPHLVDAHNNLGLLLASGGRTEEAIAHLREAVRTKPDYARAYKNLGVILLSQDKVDEAIVCFQSALKIQPDDSKTRDNLKNAFSRQQKVQR